MMMSLTYRAGRHHRPEHRRGSRTASTVAPALASVSAASRCASRRSTTCLDDTIRGNRRSRRRSPRTTVGIGPGPIERSSTSCSLRSRMEPSWTTPHPPPRPTDVEHDVEARGRPELPSRGRADSRAHHHRALLLRSQRLVAARADAVGRPRAGGGRVLQEGGAVLVSLSWIELD